MHIIREDLYQAQKILDEFIKDSSNIEAIKQAGDLLVKSLQMGNKIITCGNGGSMSDAIHFAEELTGQFRGERPSLPAIAISDPGYLTCAANDFGYEKVFSRYIEGLGKPNDVLFVISTSGNSTNVINAAEKAREKQMPVIALTGKGGGALAKLADVEIRAPYIEFSDRSQEIHIKVIHILIHYIEENISH
jgi:D-sedoheptulose 7-phosphate isomerase